VPATEFPAGSFTAIVAPLTASLNPAVTVELTATFVAPVAGVCEIIVGRAAVVKVHVTGVIIPPPVTAFAPDTVTVYVVPGASAALGVNVAIVPPPVSATLPETELPATTWTTVEPFVTARSNVTETVVPSETPVAPDAGVRAMTTGGDAIVVNDHETRFITAPAAFVAPVAVTM
jgi:hypothetical protein